MRALPVLFVTLLFISAEPAFAVGKRILTLRAAERAIDLAWQAELAEDYAGARSALQALVRSSTTAEETAARERIEEWLSTIDERESAKRAHGESARFYAESFSTLKAFGQKRSEELFRRAKKAFPQLSTTTSVMLRPERLLDVADKTAPERLVRRTLEKHGFTVSTEQAKRAASTASEGAGGGLVPPLTAEQAKRAASNASEGAAGGLVPPLTAEQAKRAASTASEGAAGGLVPPVTVQFRFEARIDVDATQSEPLERGARATVQTSVIVREKQADGKFKVSGNVQKRRVEIRRTAAEAKSFAMRRALDDASLGLIFHLRERLLADIAGGVL
jgi:hypothetical protein